MSSLPAVDPTQKARSRSQVNHLSVHYSEEKVPFTVYPGQLSSYLYERYIKPRNYRRLLDLGCGRGEYLNGFARCGLDVVGLDASSYPDRTFPEPIVTADIDGKELPLNSKSFDVVFSKSVIEHIHDTDTFLAEIYRLLKPGGIAIIMAPCWRAQYLHFYDDHTHVKPFTLLGLVAAMELQRFKIQDQRRFRQLPFLWRFPFLKPICDLLTLVPDRFKNFKTIRFSKEWMLLVVAERPRED